MPLRNVRMLDMSGQCRCAACMACPCCLCVHELSKAVVPA